MLIKKNFLIYTYTGRCIGTVTKVDTITDLGGEGERGENLYKMLKFQCFFLKLCTWLLFVVSQNLESQNARLVDIDNGLYKNRSEVQSNFNGFNKHEKAVSQSHDTIHHFQPSY